MIDYSIKGISGLSLKIDTDYSNCANEVNSSIFTQILRGNSYSPAIEYLTNLGVNRMNDIKSISMYNEINFASKVNSLGIYNEIENNNTIYLNNKFVKSKKNLMKLLELRHSARRFSELPMSFSELSTILKYSFGISNRKNNYNGVIANARYYASGGGLYPVDVYILINNVEDIKKGVYKYQPYTHSLYPITQDFDIKVLLEHGSFDFENYSFCVLYEYDINKSYLKYGELSLLTSLIELGIMSHNFELVCTSLNFAGCQIAGFDKQYAEKALDIDGINSHIVFTNICGRE